MNLFCSFHFRWISIIGGLGFGFSDLLASLMMHFDETNLNLASMDMIGYRPAGKRFVLQEKAVQRLKWLFSTNL